MYGFTFSCIQIQQTTHANPLTFSVPINGSTLVVTKLSSWVINNWLTPET